MIAPGCHDFVANLLSLSNSWLKKFVDTDAENFCQEETVLVRGHRAFVFDVRDNVSCDVALKNLELGRQHFLCQTEVVTQPGYLLSNYICVAVHTRFPLS